MYSYHHQEPSETGDLDDENGGYHPPAEVLESDRKEMVAARTRVRMVLDTLRTINSPSEERTVAEGT